MKGKKNWLLAGIIIIIALALAVFYSHKAQNQQAVRAPEETLTDKLKKLSTADLIGLGLVYERYEEKDNKDYRQVYQTALNQEIKIKKYHKYHFGNTYVKNYQLPVYYLGHGVTVVVKRAENVKETLVLVSDRGDAEDQVKLSSMYQTVTKHVKLETAWIRVRANLSVGKRYNKQPLSDQKGNSQNSTEDGDWFTIPAGMRGTWYEYDNYSNKIESVT